MLGNLEHKNPKSSTDHSLPSSQSNTRSFLDRIPGLNKLLGRSEPTDEPQSPQYTSHADEKIFRATLNREKAPATEHKYINEHLVDLTQAVNDDLELTAKDSIMEAREIILEQERAQQMLFDKFEYLNHSENLDAYCDELGLGDDVRADIEAAIPEILLELGKPTNEFFDSEIEFGSHIEYLHKFIAANLKMHLGKENGSAVLNAIISAEVDLAIITLDAQHKSPILSHRERGFGHDEASGENIRQALEENVPEMEFDIRKSKDGRAMIHHNVTLGHLGGRGERIADLNADELQNIELKDGGHLITLEKMFDMLDKTENKTTKINIDIKDFNAEMLDEILSLIKKHGAEHRVTIVSWLPQTLQYMYEREPSLSYSMSYFPGLRGASKYIMHRIGQMPVGSKLMGKFSNWYSNRRNDALARGEARLQGLAGENASDAVVLDANQHYTEMQIDTGNVEMVGRHTMPVSEKPIADEMGDVSIMARVLRNGSVNIQAIDEQVAILLERIPILSRFKDKITDLFTRSRLVSQFSRDLRSNGVRVNMFEINSESGIRAFHRETRDSSGRAGVAYSKNVDIIRAQAMDTRNKRPDIKIQESQEKKAA
ncbi:MAG: glycerophosphodiester phosphodiesterase family protein [Patescibacteria group bacterium]